MIKGLIKIKPVLVFFYVACLAGCGPEGESEVRIHYRDDQAVAASWPSGGNGGSTPRVFMADNKSQPVLGRFELRSGQWWFHPVIPFEPGTEYLVEGQAGTLGFRVAGKTPESEKPLLTALYPSADTLPQNLLKVYLVFSRPMQHIGNPLEHIRVTDLESGREVPVFLELERALWSKDQTRLTLWLNPGRIKTGLIPNMESGMPLLEGHRYRLEVDTGMRAASGDRMAGKFTHDWFTRAPDRSRPDIARWRALPPEAGNMDSIAVLLEEPMDAILLPESLEIRNSDGTSVSGRWEVDSAETRMLFFPDTPWKAGAYQLVVDPILEDLAGNTILRLFDQPIEEQSREPITDSPIAIPFTIH